MSFRYEFFCKDHSTEKAQDLVTSQNDLCRFISLTFTLYLKLVFYNNYDTKGLRFYQFNEKIIIQKITQNNGNF